MAFCVSFLVHGSVFLVIFYKFINPVLLGEAQVTARETIDFDIMDGMLSSHLDPVYDRTSKFIIKPSALIKNEDRKKAVLSDLLAQLKSSKSPALSNNSLRQKKRYDSHLAQEEENLKAKLDQRPRSRARLACLDRPSRTQIWDRMKLLKSTSQNTQVNHEDIMKVIDRHSFQFQECYERDLLRDEKLSGKVTFLLRLSQNKVQKTGLDLKGKGNALSRRELTRCLFRESKSLLFPKNTQNISVRFNLIFGL